MEKLASASAERLSRTALRLVKVERWTLEGEFVLGFRNAARRVIPKSVLRLLGRPWVIAEQQPRKRARLDSFAFYAVIGAWMEADIIEATVSNALAQGVDRVFLIDNNSPDDTVKRAVRAGAQHVLTYDSTHYDEARRIDLMSEFAQSTAESDPANHVWWLWLDADEFPRPRSGGTLRSMLESLDRRFRVVGARFLDHYPSPNGPQYVAGRHPIDYQPLCEEWESTMCWQGHRKHPLTRWDWDQPPITPTKGFHAATCATRPLSEPLEPIVIHHFPFRNEDVSRRRLEALFSRNHGLSRAKDDDIAITHMKARRDSLHAVYAGDWKNVARLSTGEVELGVSLLDWRELQPAISTEIPRWYPLAAGST